MTVFWLYRHDAPNSIHFNPIFGWIVRKQYFFRLFMFVTLSNNNCEFDSNEFQCSVFLLCARTNTQINQSSWLKLIAITWPGPIIAFQRNQNNNNNNTNADYEITNDMKNDRAVKNQRAQTNEHRKKTNIKVSDLLSSDDKIFYRSFNQATNAATTTATTIKYPLTMSCDHFSRPIPMKQKKTVKLEGFSCSSVRICVLSTHMGHTSGEQTYAVCSSIELMVSREMEMCLISSRLTFIRRSKSVDHSKAIWSTCVWSRVMAISSTFCRHPPPNAKDPNKNCLLYI